MSYAEKLSFRSSDDFAVSHQEGDIIIQESLSTQAKAIREATNSKWSHVGILFSNARDWYIAEGEQIWP